MQIAKEPKTALVAPGSSAETALAALGSAEWTRERIETFKRTLCPAGIPDDWLAVMIETARRTDLDPMKKHAFITKRNVNIGTKENPKWEIVYAFQPSDAGMLARAEKFPDFRGVTCSPVCQQDKCVIDPGVGTVQHAYAPFGERGKLVGAWARVQREGRIPIVVAVRIEQHTQETTFWGKMADVMIVKCARAAALRIAYPDAFGGLYTGDEMPAADGDEHHPRRLEAGATDETPGGEPMKAEGWTADAPNPERAFWSVPESRDGYLRQDHADKLRALCDRAGIGFAELRDFLQTHSMKAGKPIVVETAGDIPQIGYSKLVGELEAVVKGGKLFYAIKSKDSAEFDPAGRLEFVIAGDATLAERAKYVEMRTPREATGSEADAEKTVEEANI